MDYRMLCRYYDDLDGEYVEICTINLSDKPRQGELIWIESKNSKRAFVVIEVVRQFYKADTFESEVLSSDIYVCEVKLIADELKTEGEQNNG